MSTPPLVSAKLISYTQGSMLDDEFWPMDNPTELIAYCARVSNPANQNNHQTADKLISYLVQHKHWSPLQMVSACVEITAPRDISRQLLRHWTFSFQEFSQRYADPTKDLGFTVREARLQDHKNRQNSLELASDADRLREEWIARQQKVIDASTEAYGWAISNGLAKEVARVVLPEGLTSSRLYVSGTIRSFIHYIEARTHVSTQKEHRELALAIAQEISKIFPMVHKYVPSDSVSTA